MRNWHSCLNSSWDISGIAKERALGITTARSATSLMRASRTGMALVPEALAKSRRVRGELWRSRFDPERNLIMVNRTPMDPVRSRCRFLSTRTRWWRARRLPLTECYDGSRLRSVVDIPGIGRDKQPVVQERERVIGRVVEGHVETTGQFDRFRELGMRWRCLLAPILHQCRQPARSVRGETPRDRIADLVEPQRWQERAHRFIHDRSA